MAKKLTKYEQNLEDLLDEWSSDGNMNRDVPQETGARMYNIHAKYLRVFTKSKIAIDAIEREAKAMRRLRASFYDGSITKEELDAKGWGPYLGKSPKTQSQKEELLDSDPLIMEIEKRQKEFETINEAADRILKEINSRHYSIRIFVDSENKLRGN